MKNWQNLDNLVSNKYANLSMRDLFANDSQRFTKYSLDFNGLLFDYSKNLINDEIMNALFDVAKETHVEEKRAKMFAGEKINITENRAVLHTALRDFHDEDMFVDGENISKEVRKERQRVFDLVDAVHSGEWRGFSGKKITDVVNIGIGGSDLGPKMVTEALSPYHLNKTKVHFASNVDAESLLSVLAKVHPETTLFIVASKSFGTQETLLNSISAREWLLGFYEDEKAVANHFVAVSSQLDKVEEFGIKLKHCYKMWDWVGGRYSLWSSIGMPIIFAVGKDNFIALLKGGFAIDKHFQNAPMQNNIPVLLALLSILNSNFHNLQSQVILPYDGRLKYFYDYIQQVDMESNGKSCDMEGNKLAKQSAIALWGGVGTNGQHAFHQLLHQGTVTIPADFIIAKIPYHNLKNHHEALLANCFAQSQAMMVGKTEHEILAELKVQGMNDDEAQTLASHKVIAGNKPSNTFLLEELNPFILGMLIAIYEHKVFVQGAVWNVNSFDQWGVELGKVLSGPILEAIEDKKNNTSFDSSTAGLVNKVLG